MNCVSAWKRLLSTLLVILFIIFESQFALVEPALAGGNVICKGWNNHCSQVNVEVGLPEATGFMGGIVGDLTAIYSLGGVVGFSGAGITSGLAAIGSLVGGGMLAGVVITTAAPVVTAVAVGTAIHFMSQSDSPVSGQSRARG